MATGLFSKSNVEKLYGTKYPSPEQIRAAEEKYRKEKKAPAIPTNPEHDPQREELPKASDISSGAPTYDNPHQVDGLFKSGRFTWPSEFRVGDSRFTYLKSHKKEFKDMLRGGKDGYIVYQTSNKKAKEQGMGEWMVFSFKSSASTMKPTGIGFISAARGKILYERNEDIIGLVALLKIHLPSGVVALKGRVDTGAEMSSLHVDSKPKIVGDMVRFHNHNASGNVITAPLVSQQAVKSADGGVEYRPVIELDIEINGKNVSKAQFNLNDRSHMEHPILIGQNILQRTKFLVDPGDDSLEDEQFESLEDLSEEQIELIISGLNIENKTIVKEENGMAEFVLETMLGNEMTFDDLLDNSEDNMVVFIRDIMEGNEVTIEDLLNYIENIEEE